MTAESVRKIRVRVTDYSATNASATPRMPAVRAHWITNGSPCECTDPFESSSIANSNSAAIADELVKWDDINARGGVL